MRSGQSAAVISTGAWANLAAVLTRPIKWKLITQQLHHRILRRLTTAHS
jgi:hypothetical protein